MEEDSVRHDDATIKGRKTSCTYCRKRKSKCDGRYPQCSTCTAYKTVCTYDKPPSLAYVRSLEAKVESLTRLLQRISTEDPRTPNTHGENKFLQQQPLSPLRPPSITHGGDASAEMLIPAQMGDGVATWASEIHNSTSAMHEGATNALSTAGSVHRSSFSEVPDRRKENQERLMLLSNAATQRHQEESIVDNMALRGDIPREVASELLNLHWCWIHPLFLFVYRPAFIRNMAAATAGLPAPYFSDTLLRVMLGHTGRFLASSSTQSSLSSQQLVALAERARTSIGNCINEASSIPVMQALLQQSAREVVFGRSSQAWLYSGMAFRMAVDLGIHLPGESLQTHVQNLTAEDVEIRKRLFWSCYNWDKIISLYFGRMPCFLGPVPNGPIVFMDDYTENEMWKPYYGSLSENYGRDLPTYPATEGRVISTFTALCKLSTVLSMVMLEIYGPDEETLGTPGRKAQSFSKINSKLRDLWTSLPNHLVMVITQLPALSPPPHIVSLNLLYHTTSILLHRPFVAKIEAAQLHSPAVQKSFQICLTAAGAIHDLLKLQIETFGYRHITYPNSYAAYIAATIAILNYQFEEETGGITVSTIGEKLGLKFFLDVLQGTSKTMPASGRSVAIIRQHMQTVLEQSSKKKLATLFPEEMRISASISSSAPYQHTFPASDKAFIPQTTSQMAPPFGPALSPESYSFSNFSRYSIEGLPAFPGQQFSMGPDYQLNSDAIHPDARAAFLGQHLDPHMSLQHESNDWDSGFYMLDESG